MAARRPVLGPLLARAAVALGLATVAATRHFYRTPDRVIPQGETAVVSPADGLVIHLERIDSQQVSFFKREVLNSLMVPELRPPLQVVVIELNLLNVHQQRSPIAGVVTAQRYYPGQFENVLHTSGRERLVNSNEKMLTVISGARGAVGVIQVAGFVARRILAYVRPGQVVAKGQPTGMITFGSQVVVLLPEQARLRIRVGDRVTDGATILADL